MGINSFSDALLGKPYDIRSDSFGNQLVASPENLHESTFYYDKDDVKWAEKADLGGTAAFRENQSDCELLVTSTHGSRMVRQTRMYFPYQAAKGYQAFGSANLCPNGIDPGLKVMFGLFDNHLDKTVDSGGDGVFVRHFGGKASFVIRSYTSGNQVDRVINQFGDEEADPGSEEFIGWNYDKLDGKGPSKFTIDFTKSNLFALMRVQWLGVGAVAIGVIRDGQKVPCHVFYNDNRFEGVYMRRATLPVRYEIENVNSNTGGSMIQICSAVQALGRFNPRGRIWAHRQFTTRSVTTGLIQQVPTTNNILSDVETVLLALRLRPDRNRGTINPLMINPICTSNGNVTIRTYIGPAAMLQSAGWTDRSPNSIVQFTHVHGSVNLNLAFNNPNDIGFSQSTNSLITPFENTVLSGADIEGNPDVIVYTGQRIGGAAEHVSLGVSWQEWI